MSVFLPFVLHGFLLSVINPVYISPCLPVSLLFHHHVYPFPIFCFRSVFLFLVVLCFAFVFALCILYFIDFCISPFFFSSKLAGCLVTCLLVCLTFGSSLYWAIQSDFKRPAIPLERQKLFCFPCPITK